MTRIGIYGGTFSPPHNGHLKAAKAFMEQMWLDYLYVIPTALPPHKELTCEVSAQHRLEMTRLTFSGLDGVIVSDMEIRRGGRSYTVETLRELEGEDKRLFFLCGTDMMLTLDRWRESDEIFRLCYPVYVRRENNEEITKQIVSKLAEYQEKYGKIVRRIVTEPIELCSSTVRERLRNGQSVSGMILPSVEKYIRDNHLYV